MIRILKKVLVYFLIWICFFEIGRIIFLAINYHQALTFSFATLVNSMLKAIWLDMAMAGYFTMLYCLFLLLSIFINKRINLIFKYLHKFLIALVVLVTISNAVLYTYWSTPLDLNALRFLKNPKEAAASINWFLMVLPILAGALLYFIGDKLALKTKQYEFPDVSETVAVKLKSFLLILFLMVSCIVPIRGGVGIVPVNLSFVYFHPSIFPNHAAYNPLWNVLYSFTQSNNENDYHFMDDAEALRIFENLHKHSDSIAIALPVEKVDKPNVIVIVLESFLNQLINLKYKGKEVVPNLNRLSNEGIYFSNLYASGDRSDKGLVALFSGYPALPKSSLVQYPEKFSKVPSIFRDVKKAGYSTSFYYGGNLDFANLSAYFLASEVGQTVTGSSVGTNLPHGKWGVHDEAMFNAFYNGVSKMKSPFFASFFTLSNHDPYDIPGVYQFDKSNADEEYMSTAWYTDYHLGLFLDKLKSSDTWKNTLVVLVADHGVLRLNLEVFCDPAKYRIPMIWTGGLVHSPMQVSTVVSQTDIPLMILNQIGVKPNQNYTYSNWPFYKQSSQFANFYYNNGMGIATPGCTTVFDNVTLDYYAQYCQNDSIGNIAKAYLQVLSKDFTGKP